MRTNARRGAHALTLVVLTAAVSLSGRVEAQQTGLFPLSPIRRQRVPCNQEDPTYKIYKQQYFGYHPTCWRTFPAGWGCPSAEAPNRERSFREVPAGNSPEDTGSDAMPPDDRGGPAPAPRRGPGLPDLPRERDPFTTDEPPRPVPNANPLPRGNTPAPRTNPRADDPFEGLNPRGASMSPGRTRTPSQVAPAPPDASAPELSAPARTPAQGSASRPGRDADDSDQPGDDRGPLLGLADSDIVRSDTGAADGRRHPVHGPHRRESRPGRPAPASDFRQPVQQSGIELDPPLIGPS